MGGQAELAGSNPAILYVVSPGTQAGERRRSPHH